MRLSPDQALDNFNELLKKSFISLSESDTRVKKIDPIFIKCLNWEEADITREEHGETGFVDYIFKIRNMNTFVVEAKKTGYYFTIPVSYNFRKRFQIGSAISKDSNIKNALIQTQRYCGTHGVRFGMITNGEQFIIFDAAKPGTNWENGNCIVFYNLDDIRRRWTEFWNLLSKDAVEKNSFLEIIAKDFEDMTFVRPIDNIVVKNVKQPRNDLYRFITPIIGYAFQEITDPDRLDMLKQCYIYDQEFEEVDRMLKDRFSDETPLLRNETEIKKIIQKQKSSGVFQKDFIKNIEKLGADYGEPILLLLLGGVGSGKTTFIHRFFNIVLDNKKQNKLWFYVDWRNGPTNVNDIRPFILKCIITQIEKKYDHLILRLNKEFNINEISADIDCIKRVFAILRALGYVLSLVVDNVDQHKSSSQTFHENVFIETNSLTNELKLITIMTLREETYYRSSITGAFNAYYIQKYVIIPPDFIKLIVERLNYILKKLELPEEDFKRFIKTTTDFGGKLPEIKTFLEIIRNSFSRPRAEISEFMSKTSGGDMRRTLELFGNFLMSGNTKIKEILVRNKRSRGQGYIIAYHQLLKSIMLGDYKYYTDKPSYIMNIFDFNSEYSNDHFLNLKILKYAEEHLTNISEIGRGFIEINHLMKDATDVSISIKAVEESLKRMAERNLIVFDTRSKENVETADFFRITEGGSFMLNKLIKKFVYLDSVSMDTPIADPDLVTTLRTLIDSTSLDARFKRTEKFLDYLEDMEIKEKSRHPEYQSSQLARGNFTKSMISGFESERDKIYYSQKGVYY